MWCLRVFIAASNGKSSSSSSLLLEEVKEQHSVCSLRGERGRDEVGGTDIDANWCGVLSSIRGRQRTEGRKEKEQHVDSRKKRNEEYSYSLAELI